MLGMIVGQVASIGRAGVRLIGRRDTGRSSDVSSADREEPVEAGYRSFQGMTRRARTIAQAMAKGVGRPGINCYSSLEAARSGIGGARLVCLAVGGWPVMVTRFEAAGLPSEEALSVVPKSLLLACRLLTRSPRSSW